MKLRQDRLDAFKYNEAIQGVLNEIADPIFKNFHMNGFGYARFYKTGQCFDIFSDIEWQKTYFDKFDCYHLIREDLKFSCPNNSSTVLWGNSSIERNDPILNASYEHNLWHGLRIYETFEDYVDCWHFTTSVSNFQIVNFYINEINAFKRYIHYFNEKAAHLINGKKPLYCLGENPFEHQNPKVVCLKEKFKDELSIKKFKVNINNRQITFSKREAECVEHIVQNKTFKEAALKMNLSPRTVEFYVNNVKRKVNCTSSHELVSLLNQYSIKWWE